MREISTTFSTTSCRVSRCRQRSAVPKEPLPSTEIVGSELTWRDNGVGGRLMYTGVPFKVSYRFIETTM